MDEGQARASFGAMAQETRLRIVRLLVKAGPEGLPAGDIGNAMDVSPSNASFHLKELERAGLIAARRESRSILYSADYEALSGLIRFLMEDCCSGRPEICEPALATAAACCAPTDKASVQ